MNPDVFITIAFVGVVFLAALLSLVIVVPQIRRQDAGVQQSEPRSPSSAQDSTSAKNRRS